MNPKIALRPGSKMPKELKKLGLNFDFYELLPDGQTFDQPVRLWQRYKVSSFNGNPINVSVISMRSSDGTWSWVDRAAFVINSDYIYLTGFVDHFSGVFPWSEGTEVSFTGPPADAGVGDTFNVSWALSTKLTRDHPVRFAKRPTTIVTPESSLAKVIDSFEGDGSAYTTSVSCRDPGVFDFVFTADLEHFSEDNGFFSQTLKLDPPTMGTAIKFTSECAA